MIHKHCGAAILLSLGIAISFCGVASAAEKAASDASQHSEKALSLGGSFVLASPLAESYQTYQNGVGGKIQAWIPFFHEPGFSLHAEAGFQRFLIRNLADTTISQFDFMAGVEFLSPTTVLFIRPLISFDLGTYYSRLNIPGSDVTANAAFAFAMQFGPGFVIPITDSFGLNASLPFVAVLGQTRLFLMDVNVGIRINL